jgi:hypothetical protein
VSGLDSLLFVRNELLNRMLPRTVNYLFSELEEILLFIFYLFCLLLVMLLKGKLTPRNVVFKTSKPALFSAVHVILFDRQVFSSLTLTLVGTNYRLVLSNWFVY